MTLRRFSCLAAMAAFGWLGSAASRGQEVPWELFTDSQTNSTCDIVNADGLELVVLRETGELVVVTSVDVIIDGSLVDEQGTIFIDGEPSGFLSFATDGDNTRTLWWLDNLGIRVVRLDALTLQPSVTNKTPDDYQNVPCDACLFWDGNEPACEIPTTIITQPRGGTYCAGRDITISIEAVGSFITGFQWFKNGESIPDATSFTLQLEDIEETDTASYRVDIIEADGTRVSSNNATVVVSNCSVPNFMCGSASSATMALSVVGLAAMGVRRRRN